MNVISADIIIATLLGSGALYFAVTWATSRWETRARTNLERRQRQIDAAHRERVTLSARASAIAVRWGWTGDLSIPLVGLLFVYTAAAAALSVLGLSGWTAVALALPVASLVVAWVTATAAERRRNAFNRQLVQALDLLVAQLKAGSSPQLALERVVPNLPDPLRSEFDQALARRRATMNLSEAVASIAKRYPSRAMSMLVAALRIDEEGRGAKMALALEQAAATVRRDFELRSESDAEIAQERMQFFGIVGIVTTIALMLILRGSDSQREALMSPMGFSMLAVAAGNFVFGILRVLKMLEKAKGGER